MITGFFLQIFVTVLGFFVSLLPLTPYPVDVANAILSVWDYINAFSFLFPVTTLLQVLTIAFLFHATVIAWHFAHMVARYLRGR